MVLQERVHVAWLEIGDANGTTLASGNLIDEIRVMINNKPQRVMTGVELNALNGINGAAFTAKTSGVAGQAGYRTYLPIFFAEPWRKNPVEAANMAWNANGIKSFNIEVDLNAGLITPVLGGIYEWEPATGVIGLITKWLRQDLQALGTMNDFNRIESKDWIHSIHLFPTVEAIPKYVNKVKFSADGEIIQDLLTTVENQVILLGRELQPDTSATPRFDLIFDYDDPINGALNTAGLNALTLHCEYNAGAAGSMRALVQRTGAPE
jgi:hypothetical protein